MQILTEIIKKPANDYRSALFYLVYYPNANQVKNSSQAIVMATSALNNAKQYWF